MKKTLAISATSPIRRKKAQIAAAADVMRDARIQNRGCIPLRMDQGSG